MRLVALSIVLAGCGPVDLAGLPGPVGGRILQAGRLSPVAGATVRATQFPRVFGDGDLGGEHATWQTVTDADGSFAFDPFTVDGYDATQALPAGRTRFVVSAPGYDDAVFYRDVSFASTCAADLGRRADVGCDKWTFDLVPSDAVGVDLLPDVMVDPASIADCRLQTEGPELHLRMTVATPNGGRGPVDLRSEPESTVVRQRVYTKGGDTHEVVVEDAAFEWDGHEDHNHFHFADWTHLHVLDASATQLLAVGTKISFCLIDLNGFDREIYEGVWGVPTRFGCGLIDGEIQQGLSPGLMDVYDRTLAGQDIDVTSLAPGEYLLEVEVDPLGFVTELTRDNNVARVRFVIPDGPVHSGFNPCQPEYEQPFLTDELPLDTSGRTELALSSDCAAADAATALTPGAWWGDVADGDDVFDFGEGNDGLARVVVPAGKRLELDGTMDPGDLMLAVLPDCSGAAALASVDDDGRGDDESLRWRNTSSADRAVYVLVDDYDTDAGDGLFVLDVAFSD